MTFLLFNCDAIPLHLCDKVNDPSDLTDEEFKILASEFGMIYENHSDFESGFNAEHFSTATHQLRITE